MLRRYKFVMLVSLLVAMLFCGCSETENKEISVPTERVGISVEDIFEDKVFREYVSDKIDLNKDGMLSDEEIAKVQEININGNLESSQGELQSLAGVELFHELKNLTCYNCNLNEVDVSKNEKLEELTVGFTKLDSIDVKNNKMLKELNCSGTNIEEIDLSANTLLEYINVDKTGVAEIDLSMFPELVCFSCVNSKISELDVTTNSKLRSLYIGYTDISTVDLSNNPELTFISCIGAKSLMEIDLSHNPKLESVYCHQAGIEKLDISNNPNAFEVECCDDIEVIGGENLTYFMQYPRKDKAE